MVLSIVLKLLKNILKTDKNTLAGIRPENIYFDDNGLNASISYREWHGNIQMLRLETSRGPLTMTCNSSDVLSDTIKVSWSKEKELQFYLNSGKIK